MNILAFGAHPDDVEEMCFGTLMKYRAQGDTIFIALSTSGNIGSNCHASREEIAAIREKEQLQAAAPLEAKVKFLRFDDEELRVRREADGGQTDLSIVIGDVVHAALLVAAEDEAHAPA